MPLPLPTAHEAASLGYAWEDEVVIKVVRLQVRL